jgi:leucyl/phenylalanyl-tRNA--protein transferase
VGKHERSRSLNLLQIKAKCVKIGLAFLYELAAIFKKAVFVTLVGLADMLLTPELLLSAYAQGVFPMAGEDDRIYWYDPDPRAILPLNKFHIPRSLRRTVRRGDYKISRDTAFGEVIRACAKPSLGREETWINEAIIEAYEQLHRLGFAHSVEVWRDDLLVGGLYGLTLNGLFAGESMFSRERDASKVALVHLVAHLRRQGFVLLDVQFMTEHLERFGAIEITRDAYKNALAEALNHPAQF